MLIRDRSFDCSQRLAHVVLLSTIRTAVEYALSAKDHGVHTAQPTNENRNVRTRRAEYRPSMTHTWKST